MRLQGVVAIALVLLCSTGLSCQANEPPQSEGSNMKSKGDKAPPPRPAAKRPAPPSVPAVTFEKVRYEQAYQSTTGEYAQHSGFLAAFDQASGKHLWTVRVYEVAIDRQLERDVQEVFFASMSVDQAQRAISIENERDERFLVSVDSREVRPIAGK